MLYVVSFAIALYGAVAWHIYFDGSGKLVGWRDNAIWAAFALLWPVAALAYVVTAVAVTIYMAFRWRFWR